MSLKDKIKDTDNSLFDLAFADIEDGELDDKTLDIILNMFSKEYRNYKRYKNLDKIHQIKKDLNSGKVGYNISQELPEGAVLVDQKGDPLLNEKNEPLTHEESVKFLNDHPKVIYKDQLKKEQMVQSMTDMLNSVKGNDSKTLLPHINEMLTTELSRIKNNAEAYNMLMEFGTTFKNEPLRDTRYDGLSEKELIERIHSTSLNKEFSHKKLSDLFTSLYRIRKNKQGIKVNLLNEITVGNPHFRLSGAAGFVQPIYNKNREKAIDENNNTVIPETIENDEQVFKVISQYLDNEKDKSKSEDPNNVLKFSLQLGDPYTYLHKMSSFGKGDMFINYMIFFLHETQHEKQFSDFVKTFQNNKMTSADYAIAMTGLLSYYGIEKHATDYNYKLCEIDAYTSSIIQLMDYVDKDYINLSIEEIINLYGEMIYHLDMYKSKDINEKIATQMINLSNELSYVLPTYAENIFPDSIIKDTINYFQDNFTKYDKIRLSLEKDIIKFVQPIDDLIPKHSIKYETNKNKNLDNKLLNSGGFDFNRCNSLLSLAVNKLSAKTVKDWADKENNILEK